MGSLPLDLSVPRVRSGQFRPQLLPDKYQRVYRDEHQDLLLSVLAASKSKNAAKESLRRLNVPYSEEQVDRIISQTLEAFTLNNTKPLDSDLIGLFIDAKPIDIKEGNLLKPFTI